METLSANLGRYGLAVKERFSPDHPMGIGLWIAAPAARKLQDPDQLQQLRQWLAEHDLVPFTLNGFPFGDFHERVVKQRVYHPTWFETERLRYTLDLIAILHAILPPGMEGSISTLPIAWRAPSPTDEQLQVAVEQLVEVAQRLARLEEETGRLIYVCLEAEPGCYLQCCWDMVQFFQTYFGDDGHRRRWRRYIRVCHDVCHSAVMFEDQAEVLQQYALRAIGVGKVQVSSAVQAEFQPGDREQNRVLAEQLASFAEDRYLHQATLKRGIGEEVEFFDDLSEALAAARTNDDYFRGTWRVHFHVPIYLEQFGAIGTTRHHIGRCLQALESYGNLTHFEVETYAWGVLPAALQHPELADGIAQEMQWLVKQPQWHVG